MFHLLEAVTADDSVNDITAESDGGVFDEPKVPTSTYTERGKLWKHRFKDLRSSLGGHVHLFRFEV